MSKSRGTTVWAQLRRLVLLTTALAPLVALVLIGLGRLHRVTPGWVYWEVELIFLLTLKVAYQVTALLSFVGSLVIGFLLFRAVRKGERRPLLARGFMLCITLLSGLALSEVVCAAWLSWSRRDTAVRVGGLEPGKKLESAKGSAPALRFAQPFWGADLRTNFSDPPGDHEIDLVVLGESSAQGVPYDRWLSIGKIVAWKLHEAIPTRPIRLNVVARAGDTLEAQHKLLCNIQRRPDLLIVYCGHNEFYSRLWWARNIEHYVTDRRPKRWEVFFENLERLSPLCTLVRESADKCRIAIPPPSNTGRELVDVPSYTAIEYTAILTDFRRRLEEMVSYAERVGALPVLILPPGNDTGFEPNRSFLPPSTPRAEREAFSREFLAARASEDVDAEAAIEHYRALIAHQPCFAETHFRLGRLFEQAGRWDDAYREYTAARDLDGMPMRCPSAFQQVYRDVAERHGCILVDGQSYFHAIGRRGLLDDELFQDAMHPSLRGQIALAQAVLVALHARRAFGWPDNSAVPIVDPAECVAQFGIDKSSWHRIALWWKGFNELTSPLRYDTNLRRQKREAGIVAAAKIEAGVDPNSVGLPNVGIPAAVPPFPNGRERTPVSTVDVMPCLVE
jgi:tetratricopeptide (TPR) repeat protein